MEVDNYAPGTFCWAELGTTDQRAAKKFYSGLFGWDVNDMPMGPEDFYSMLQSRGKDVAALYRLRPERLAPAAPPHWLLYVSTENVDATAAAVTAAGGKILTGPLEVFDAGRVAVAQDPLGATFGIWQARKHIGAQVRNEANAVCWNELVTRDTATSSDFYNKVFGWKFQIKPGPMIYTEFHLNGQAGGGMFNMPSGMDAIEPHWLPYFAVEDCDAKVGKARSLGGVILAPPEEILKVGRFASIADPQGAAFSIIELHNQT
jgi:predicted enzyme related to lactoylglutathione lyase